MNPVMESQYSKSTKTNEEVLASSRQLTLDVIRPFTKLLKKLNLEETDIIAEEVGYVMESYITLLDIAPSQISGLCRQKVLKQQGPLSFEKEREATIIKATLLLLRSQFPKDALLRTPATGSNSQDGECLNQPQFRFLLVLVILVVE